MEYIGTQGVNGPIWALIALDSHDYPTSGDVTREKLVQTILDAAAPGRRLGARRHGGRPRPDRHGA